MLSLGAPESTVSRHYLARFASTHNSRSALRLTRRMLKCETVTTFAYLSRDERQHERRRTSLIPALGQRSRAVMHRQSPTQVARRTESASLAAH